MHHLLMLMLINAKQEHACHVCKLLSHKILRNVTLSIGQIKTGIIYQVSVNQCLLFAPEIN